MDEEDDGCGGWATPPPRASRSVKMCLTRAMGGLEESVYEDIRADIEASVKLASRALRNGSLFFLYHVTKAMERGGGVHLPKPLRDGEELRDDTFWKHILLAGLGDVRERVASDAELLESFHEFRAAYGMPFGPLPAHPRCRRTLAASTRPWRTRPRSSRSPCRTPCASPSWRGWRRGPGSR
jgi:hypothetical protein